MLWNIPANWQPQVKKDNPAHAQIIFRVIALHLYIL